MVFQKLSSPPLPGTINDRKMSRLAFMRLHPGVNGKEGFLFYFNLSKIVDVLNSDSFFFLSQDLMLVPMQRIFLLVSNYVETNQRAHQLSNLLLIFTYELRNIPSSRVTVITVCAIQSHL